MSSVPPFSSIKLDEIVFKDPEFVRIDPTTEMWKMQLKLSGDKPFIFDTPICRMVKFYNSLKVSLDPDLLNRIATVKHDSHTEEDKLIIKQKLDGKFPKLRAILRFDKNNERQNLFIEFINNLVKAIRIFALKKKEKFPVTELKNSKLVNDENSPLMEVFFPSPLLEGNNENTLNTVAITTNVNLPGSIKGRDYPGTTFYRHHGPKIDWSVMANSTAEGMARLVISHLYYVKGGIRIYFKLAQFILVKPPVEITHNISDIQSDELDEYYRKNPASDIDASEELLNYKSEDKVKTENTEDASSSSTSNVKSIFKNLKIAE